MVGLALGGVGEGLFNLGRGGDQQLKERKKLIEAKKARGENTLWDETLQVGQTGLGEVGKTIGTAADVGFAPFRMLGTGALKMLGINQLPGQDKSIDYNNAKFDSRVREHARGWMNRIDFMNIIPDQKGGFGNIYGNQAAQAEMMGNMSEGGIVPSSVPPSPISPMAKGGIAPGLYDNPTRGMLSPGQSCCILS